MSRPPRDAWSPEEDAYLRECVEVVGCPIPKLQREWPSRFPRRSVAALRMRKVALALVTNPNPDLSQKGVPQPKPEVPTQTVDVKDDGTMLHVTAIGSEVKTLDELVARAKIDLTKYEVDKPETSMHETTIRDPEGKVRKVQNFRIVARFRLKAGPSTKEQVEALIAGAFAKRSGPKVKPHRSSKHLDVMQAIVIADPHIGKYAHGEETGWANYDVNTATRLLRESSEELLAWGEREGVGRRAIWMLGDIAHYDTPHGSTTKGTPLDRDGRVDKMIREASSVLTGIVEASAKLGQTDVVMVQGNHDFLMSLAFRHILSAYFRHDQRVTIDERSTTRKYVTHGKCLFGLTHGDKATKRLGELMSIEAREDWGRSTLKEIHHGHLHSEASTTTISGVTIRQHPALTAADGWHAQEGFVGAPRAMHSYTYHSDGFLVGMRRASVKE